MRLKVYALAIAVCVLSVATVRAEEEAKSEPKKNPSPKVKLETSLGDIVLELDREKAPISVENFLTYVNEGFYEGLIFHRVIPGFMIQSGGMDAQMVKKRDGMHSPIKLESNNGLKNLRGTIAMARMRHRIRPPVSFSSMLLITACWIIRRPSPNRMGTLFLVRS